jgi:hypothetical protein
MEWEQVPRKQDCSEGKDGQTLSHVIPVRLSPVLGPARFVRWADAGLSSTP